MSEFEQAQQEYEKLRTSKFQLEKRTLEAVNEVQELLKSLDSGISGGGYLSWTLDLLLEHEFRLARYAEFLGSKASEADGRYAFFKDKYKQRYLIDYRENKRTMNLREEKVTVADIDAQTTQALTEFQDKVNILFEYSRYLNAFIDSIQRYLLAITHRIKELQSEKRLPQS